MFSCNYAYFLYWFGILENAFRAAYGVLAERQQQQTNKPKISRF